MTSKKLLIGILLISICGCAYTKSHQLPTVLTTKDWRGIIPKGQAFKAMQSPAEGLKEFTFPDEDMVVLSMGKLQELTETANSRTIKKSRISKKQMMWGGGITSLLGIIATIFWNRRKKLKIDAGFKAEA